MASRRNYVTTAEVDELTGNSTGATDLQISEAEELIDAFVGPQEKDIQIVIEGRVSAVPSSSQLTLQSDYINQFDVDYFKYCEVEIIGGAGAGQRKTITGSTKEGVLTVASAFSTALGVSSFYRIYQLGKFPRRCDVSFYSQNPPSTYYKQIPEAVKRATAAQVEYMIAMGDNFFKTDQAEKIREKIGDYEYENASGQAGSAGVAKFIAPKAKLLLRGIKNITGQILA